MKISFRIKTVVLLAAFFVLFAVTAFLFMPLETSSAQTKADTIELTSANIGTYAPEGKLSAGVYELGSDIILKDDTLGFDLQIDGEVTLDLSGFTLMGTGNGPVITVNEGATFTLKESNDFYTNPYYLGDDGLYVYDDGSNEWDYAYNAAYSKGEIKSGVITGGVANSAAMGGGIYSEGTFVMEGGYISGNFIPDSAPDEVTGAGIHIAAGTFTMIGGTIQGNTAYNDGAGVYVAAGARFDMSGGSVYHNISTANGGGVYTDGTFVMNGGTLRYNVARIGNGVYVGNGASFSMSDGRIYDNSADQTGIGVNGIYVESTAAAAVTNGYIEGDIEGEGTISVTGGYFASGDTDAQTVCGYAVDQESYIIVKLANNWSDKEYNSAFPYALYNRGVTEIVFEKADKIVYDGSSIKSGEDFQFTYSYTGTADGDTCSVIYYSDAADGEFIDSTAQWQSLPKKAGTWYLKAKAQSNYYPDTRTYYPVTESDVYPITIEKAPAPIPEIPTGLELTYGEMLADIELSDGWEWTDDAIVPCVADSGTEYAIRFSVSAAELEDDNYDWGNIQVDENNYYNATVAVKVNPKRIVIEGVTAVDRAYDGTMAVQLSGGELQGLVAGDTVGFELGTGSLSDKNAGNNRMVSTNIVLTGEDAENYTLTSPTLHVDISKVQLTVAGTAATDRVYNGKTDVEVTLGSISGKVEGDDLIVSVTGILDSADAGEDKTVTLSYAIGGDDADNYICPEDETTTVNITKASIDMSGVEWDYAGAFTYDGQEKSVSLTGVPSGVTVAYTNEKAADAGTYTAKVKFTFDENYELVNAGNIQTLTWTINKAIPDFTLPENLTAIYGETLAAVELPEGWAWKESSVSVGNYGENTFAAVFTPDDTRNYLTVEENLTVIVSKASIDMSGVEWDYAGAFTYDGQEKRVSLTGVPSGVTVAYTNEKAANAGVYTAKVQFDYDNENYSLTNLSENIQTLTWEIKKAVYDMSGVEFKDKTVTYDGTKKSLVIAGELPKGVTVSYSANGQINAGIYKVTVSFAGDYENYERISDMTATLTIEKAMPDYKKIPEGMTATEGQTLSDIVLPEGWSWKDGSVSVGEEGERAFAAVYTPMDTANYNTATVELTVNVLATEFPVGMIVGIALGCIFGLLLIVYGIGAVLYKKGKLQGPFFDKIYPFIKA